MINTQDTIAAIATPIGRGAIGIIRISGDLALPVLKQIFKSKTNKKEFVSHRLYYGEIFDPNTKEVIDEVLCVYMKAPHTYTCEDVVEIYAHGSPFILRKILEVVFSLGVRPAKPGEFTYRAFLNGRIDLAQAEAINELISSQNEYALKSALKTLKGELSKKIESLRNQLLEILAHLESKIEFPEEDIETKDYKEIERIIKNNLLPIIESLINAYDQGKIFKEGIFLVLAGKPNVGKSSLMNVLLNEERAIVSPVPGTTRDFLEEEVLIEGIPVRLIDTAGIRPTEDLIEKLGLEKTKKKLESADLIIWLIDISHPPQEEDKKIFEEISKKPNFLTVFNKIDLQPNFIEEWVNFIKELGIEEWVEISVKEQKNLDELKKKIVDKIFKIQPKEIPEVIPNLRQKVSLEKAKESLNSVLNLLNSINPLPEIIVLELKEALTHLEEIIGKITSEDVLEQIFSTFCIGK